MNNDQTSVDVVIPSYRPDEKFSRLVKKLQEQEYPIGTIFVINTKAGRFPKEVEQMEKVKVYHIERREFDHGATRDMGMQMSKAEIVVFMTQDAVPADEYVIGNLVKVLDFAANTYGQMTDGFIREDLKSLRKAVSSTNDEKDILKKIRRKETLGMRRIDRNVAIEKNTWFHLGSNSSEQMMYCLKRMCEPCKEHVDNNFNPLPAECAEEFVPIRDMLKSLLERTKDIIDKGNYEEADLVLAEGEELKTCLSRLHKMRIERMQEENSSVKLSLVYLNLLQESQELVSIMRHMLRASRKFQHV